MVSTIIRGHRLDGFINGMRNAPARVATGDGQPGFGVRTNPDYEQWVVCDQLLMEWLYGSMTKAIATEVMGCTSARSLWTSLENLYGAHSQAKMDDLRTMLQTTRKGSTTMADYLRQKRSWSDQLALAGDPYPESHLVSNVLSGLDVEYITIVALIEAKNNLTPLTWQELQETLLSLDSKLERLGGIGYVKTQGSSSSTPPSAHLAS
ncbi:hypothetical protein CsatB_001922 [Cannabis sativa]|uniref:uncharacterized protein LOC115696770 n=1 Tax=Cannabis sativa TaxID=3483 RepID=UPI0011DF9657|nr:uncharacterized protein LOC115696770 [Cannabis sativa]